MTSCPQVVAAAMDAAVAQSRHLLMICAPTARWWLLWRDPGCWTRNDSDSVTAQRIDGDERRSQRSTGEHIMPALIAAPATPSTFGSHSAGASWAAKTILGLTENSFASYATAGSALNIGSPSSWISRTTTTPLRGMPLRPLHLPRTRLCGSRLKAAHHRPFVLCRSRAGRAGRGGPATRPPAQAQAHFALPAVRAVRAQPSSCCEGKPTVPTG